MGDVNQNVNLNLKVRDQGLTAAVDQLGDGLADLAVIEVDVRTKAELAAAAFDTVDLAAIRAAAASAEFTAALGKMGDRLVGLVPLEDGASRSTTEFERSLRRLDHVLQEVDDDELVFARTTKTQVTPALDQAAAGVEKATKSKRNMAQAALQGSRALQDFVQGGLGGILNNVEGVAAALGGGPGIAGLMTVLGVTAFVAMGPVKALWAAITGGAEKMPEAADKVSRISDALDEVKDSLEELSKADGLTAAEVAKATELLEKRVSLEKALNDEKERGKALDEALKKKPTSAESEAAQNMQEILQGPAAETAIRALEANLRKSSGESNAPGQLGDLRVRLKGLLKGQADHDRDDPWNLTGSAGYYRDQIAAIEARIKAQDETLKRQAQDVVLKTRAGDRGALGNTIAALPADEKSAGGKLRGLLEANTPEAIKAHDAEAGGVGEYTPEQKMARDKRRKDKKLVDQLNREGSKAESEYWAAQDEQAAKLEAAAEKQAQDGADREAKLLLQNHDRDDREAKKAAREAEKDTPGARLRARRDGMYQRAAGIATAENDALPPDMRFNPSQLESIAREAADTSRGIDSDSMRQAVYRGAEAMRVKVQREMDLNMGRMWQGGDSIIQ